MCEEHRVPCVISWETKVEDEAAMTFAAAFYQYLSKERSRSESFEEAFKMARRRLRLRVWVLKDPDDQVNESGMKKAAGVPSLFVNKEDKESHSKGIDMTNRYEEIKDGLLVLHR